MPEPTTASYRFFSWLRQGLLAGLSNQAGASPPLTSGHLVLPIRLRVNSAAPVDVNIQLYGPGDITGIDAREVIRTEPQAHMTDFEPNYFPAIEFDRPDFPWLFTPAKADAARRLHPWICLIVVRKEGAALSTVPRQPLPVLTCGQEELPDLDQSWAWAHAQIVSGQTASPNPTLQQILKDHPDRTLSRLLGARRLDPNTAYYACLVPTYDVGRKAGLGEPITADDEQALKPAWSKGPGAPTGTVSLPVYFHWEFRTGLAGDFESLARRLEPKQLPTTVGLRPMDIGQPGWGMPVLPPNAPGNLLDLGGALRTPETNPRTWPEAAQTSFQNSLRTILNEPAAHTTPDSAPAVLGPPLYGQWYTDQQTIPAANQPPHWFRELNLDPCHRVAAGVGTQVIRFEQEPLMASAWDQLEQQRQDHARLKRAQLAETVGDSLFNKHLLNLPATRLVQLTGPSRTALAGSASAGAPVPDPAHALFANPAASGALRRITRPRGPIAARMDRLSATHPTAPTLTVNPQKQSGTMALFTAATSTRADGQHLVGGENRHPPTPQSEAGGAGRCSKGSAGGREHGFDPLLTHLPAADVRGDAGLFPEHAAAGHGPGPGQYHCAPEDESGIDRSLHGRPESRNEPRIALARLSYRPARHLLPAILGCRRRTAPEHGSRAGVAARHHPDRVLDGG